MCASSNWSAVRTSTTQRARALLHARPGAASSGCASTPRRISGPRLMSTTAWKFGGWGGSARVARSTKRSSSSSAQQLVVAALEADRGGDLHVHAGPAAQRAAEMPRPHLDAVGEARAASRAGSGRCRARPRPCRRRGRAARCRPRTGCRRSAPPTAPGRAPCRSARTPCARAGARACGARARARDPELQLPAVVERLVVVVRRARRGGRGSWRRSRWRAGRGRRRGRRGCASRGCARSTRPCSAPGAGTRRSRASGRRPPPRRRPRRRPGRRRSRGRRG